LQAGANPERSSGPNIRADKARKLKAVGIFFRAEYLTTNIDRHSLRLTAAEIQEALKRLEDEGNLSEREVEAED